MIYLVTFPEVDKVKSKKMTDLTPLYPRWMRLRDAARYSAIGRKRLVALAQNRDIKGWQDPDSGRGDWIFDRLSLDAYREAQDPEPTLDQKALDIVRKMSQ